MRQTAVDKAYLWVRERILDGTIPPGSFIDEATVCEGAGVSRTPAREAFNRLEGERFITLAPRRGAQVRELTTNDLYDAFSARIMVETHVAKEFCERRLAIPEDMRVHLKAMDAMEDFSTNDSVSAYIDADQMFHGALVRTLGNRAIDDFFLSLWRVNKWSALTRGGWLRSPHFLCTNREQHHAILEHLAAHDGPAVVEVLRQHLRLGVPDMPVFP